MEPVPVNTTDQKQRPARIVAGAVGAGVAIFIALYIMLALGLVFALSLLSESIASHWIELLFKLCGILASVFPGYAAARIAGQRGLLHGLLTGAGAAAVSALFMTLTFSWEGSARETVGLAIIKIALLSLMAGGLGGLCGDWMNRRQRGTRKFPPAASD